MSSKKHGHNNAYLSADQRPATGLRRVEQYVVEQNELVRFVVRAALLDQCAAVNEGAVRRDERNGVGAAEFGLNGDQLVAVLAVGRREEEERMRAESVSETIKAKKRMDGSDNAVTKRNMKMNPNQRRV
jgi:hypothetical protein